MLDDVEDITERSDALDVIAQRAWQCRLAEQCLRMAVRKARESQETWESIGKTLGISRQAAHDRFGQA